MIVVVEARVREKDNVDSSSSRVAEEEEAEEGFDPPRATLRTLLPSTRRSPAAARVRLRPLQRLRLRLRQPLQQQRSCRMSWPE